MGKKDKSGRTPVAWKKALHMVKTVLKVSTHVFTAAGVIIAATPVTGGLKLAATGDFKAAQNALQYDTIGSTGSGSVTLTGAAKNAIANVGIPILIGIGLVWSGT